MRSPGLKTAHPQLAVSVREATPGTLVEELVAGHLDLIVGRITEPGEHKGRRRP
ncbi:MULTISPECIES: hypothetical protein [unclassified Amycolatopsis]|uniref:hypothetical protein n=1 Tax=unclassified Amycolatopsis TaxID=2618356 RepID=UPI001C69F544|nr:hypothetical protein [Amycolatopsis sp. DSM 110486]QYN21374.1 hypothetical protein K1T34_02075 [Amycolatopsis sp. DSM 110486]